MEKLTGPTWSCLALTNTHIWKYLAHHAQRPYHVPIFSPYGKTPWNLENPNSKSPLQGKIPTSEGSWFTTRHHISTRPPLFLGTQKIPSSLTIEFLKIFHSLAWPLEGFWLVSHRCLLFGLFVLAPQVPIGVIWHLQLIDDFSTSSLKMNLLIINFFFEMIDIIGS